MSAPREFAAIQRELGDIAVALAAVQRRLIATEAVIEHQRAQLDALRKRVQEQAVRCRRSASR